MSVIGNPSLDNLARIFGEMVADLDVDPSYKFFWTTPRQDGSPHIEVLDGGFHFVVTERGQEFERIGGLSAEDVLYLLLKGITQCMAVKDELRNRIPGTDGRSIWFPFQEELMENLRSGWGERLRAEHGRILVDHPIEGSGG